MAQEPHERSLVTLKSVFVAPPNLEVSLSFLAVCTYTCSPPHSFYFYTAILLGILNNIFFRP